MINVGDGIHLQSQHWGGWDWRACMWRYTSTIPALGRLESLYVTVHAYSPSIGGGWRTAAILREPGWHSETLRLRREILKPSPPSIFYYVIFILHFIVWAITYRDANLTYKFPNPWMADSFVVKLYINNKHSKWNNPIYFISLLIYSFTFYSFFILEKKWING